MGEQIHMCFGVGKNCWNFYDSYGQICVGCGCCSPNQLERAEARLALCKRLLEEWKNFDAWDKGHEELQKRNVALNIQHFKRRIRYYEKRVGILKILQAPHEK